MTTTSNIIILSILSALFIILTILLRRISNKKNKRQLEKIFVIIFGLILFWLLCSISQIISVIFLNYDNLILFDSIAFVSVTLLPVSFFFMALTFARTKITFKKWVFIYRN